MISFLFMEIENLYICFIKTIGISNEYIYIYIYIYTYIYIYIYIYIYPSQWIRHIYTLTSIKKVIMNYKTITFLYLDYNCF